MSSTFYCRNIVCIRCNFCWKIINVLKCSFNFNIFCRLFSMKNILMYWLGKFIVMFYYRL